MNTTHTRLWQRPSLHSDDTGERKATWIELFFDLIFVVAIFELSHVLSADISWLGLGGFVLLFFPVYLIWLGNTVYNDRFETNDVGHRLLMFVKLGLIVSLAVHVHGALGDMAIGFAISYALARILLALMWVRAGWHNTVARPMTTRYGIGFSLSGFLWLGSIFFVAEPAVMYSMWVAGLLVDLITPITTFHIQKKLPSLSMSHLPERMGLFVLIVLGESIISVSQGLIGLDNIEMHHVLAGLTGLLLTFGLWWLYFDHIMSKRPQQYVYKLGGWIYAHTPLAISLTSIGAGIYALVKHPAHADAAVALIAGAAAMAMTMMGLIERTLENTESPCQQFLGRVFRFGSAVVVAGVAIAAGLGLVPVSVALAILLLCLGLQVIYGLRLHHQLHLDSRLD